MWMIIESDCIYYSYEYEPGEFSDPMLFMNLDNYAAYKYEIISEERSSTRPLETEEYVGQFNAITSPNGIVALKNNDFTFNFTPATGLLTRLEPDYLEIGELDQIK